jgi:hypothetical protein
MPSKFIIDEADDLVARRLALAEDLERLAAGWKPDAETLAAAPLIDLWTVIAYPGGTEPALQGLITGHPTLTDGPGVTSPIRAIDFSDRWARSDNRFYRLGTRSLGG